MKRKKHEKDFLKSVKKKVSKKIFKKSKKRMRNQKIDESFDSYVLNENWKYPMYYIDRSDRMYKYIKRYLNSNHNKNYDDVYSDLCSKFPNHHKLVQTLLYNYIDGLKDRFHRHYYTMNEFKIDDDKLIKKVDSKVSSLVKQARSLHYSIHRMNCILNNNLKPFENKMYEYVENDTLYRVDLFSPRAKNKYVYVYEYKR